MDDIEYVIETRGLCYTYEGGKTALKDVSIRIPTGCKVAFLGPNGAGKSTLFMHLNGILKPTSGEVLYRSKPIDRSKKGLIGLRKDIAFVMQNPDDQIFNAIVEDDVAFGPFNMDMPIDIVRSKVDLSLKMVGMENERSRPIHHLSFGQRKRVAVASALAMEPNVLIMDEPTAGLDQEMVYRLYEIADEVNMKGSTVIISTHDVETAYSWADIIVVISEGRIIASGTPFEVFSMKDVLDTAGLTVPMIHMLNEYAAGDRRDLFGRTMSTAMLNIQQDVRPGRLRVVGPGEEGGIRGKVGVYGSASRRFTESEGIEPDFRFNAIERCMEELLGGHDATIFLDRELDHVLDRRLLEIAGHDISIEAARGA